MSEREVYRQALAKNVIDQSTFNDLEELYGQRNRVVHRYILSELSTKDVLQIALEYNAMIDRVSEFVAKLEQKQVELGVGMVCPDGGDNQYSRQDFLRFTTPKHGADELARRLRED